MPTHAGPNPSADNSIVFSYDVGDTSNSYRGEPTVNHYGDISTSIALRTPLTEYNTSNWDASFPKPPENIGRVYKHTSGALSSTWDGNSYGYTLKTYTYPAGAIYTLSAWVYVSPDCNINQLNISIEGGGTWVDNNYLYDLSKKGTWQQIWLEINTLGGFAGNAIPIYPQRYGVTDGSFTGFYAWGGAMLEAKDHITQYTVSSRSATQGLLPLLGNTTLDLSNVSFDSNAQITFDGTDDFFNIPTNFGTLTQYTIEYVAFLGAVNKMPIAARTNTNFYKYGDNSWRYVHGGVADEFYHETSPAISGYIHCVVTYDGSLVKVWRNGYYAGSKASSGTADFSDGFKIGYWAAGGSYAWSGPIPIVKIYNTALSTDQVQQNYRQYKTRFNLS
jgi:hypothetical protein